MLKVNFKLETDGRGLWSKKQRTVNIVGLELIQYKYDIEIYGELRVYFDIKTWSVNKCGLIYTDSLFLKQLQKQLAIIFHTPKMIDSYVDYSEQGMQGNNYVSLDVNSSFCKLWDKNTKEVLVKNKK